MTQSALIMVPDKPDPNSADPWDEDEVMITDIHVRVGDQVSAGQALFEVETAKTALEVAAPVEGAIGEIRAQLWDKMKPNTVVMTIDVT